MLERKLISEKDSLKVELIQDPNDPIWEEVYQLYCKRFPIASERDSLEDLRKYINFNLDGTFGPDNNPLAKDNNLVAFKSEKVVAVRMIEWIRLEQNYSIGFGSYIFTNPNYRGLGTIMQTHAEQLIKEQSQRNKTSLLGFFSEVNDPQKMNDETLELDRHAMDPHKRIRFFRKRGFEKLDTHYEQPALSLEEEIVPYLSIFFKPKMQAFTKELLASIFLDVVEKYFNLFLDIQNPKETESYKKIEQATQGKNLIQLL